MKTTQLRKLIFSFFFLSFATAFTADACTVNASFTYIDSSGFIRITNTSNGGNRFVWNYGPTVKHFGQYIYYKAAGTYKVTLTVLDTLNSSCYDTFTTQIITAGVCWLQAKYNSAESSTVLNQVKFTISGNYWGDSSIWTYGDGNSSTHTLYAHDHQFPGPGTYTVKYKTFLKGVTGCSDSISGVVNLKGCTVKADFNFTDKGNLNFQFVNTSTNASKYDWQMGDGTHYTIKDFWFLFKDSGTYNVRLIAKQSGKELCADTVYKRVLGKVCKVKAWFTHTFSGDVKNKNFINLSSHATFYQWDFGDTSFSTNEYPSHMYSRTGVYNVKLICTDTGFANCSDTFTSDVGAYTCNVNPKIGFTDSLGYVTYTSLSTGSNLNYWYISYSRFMTDSFYGNTHSKQFNNCTQATISLISYDTIAMCSNRAFLNETITPLVPSFEIIEDSSNNYAILILDKSRSGISTYTYHWDFGDGDTTQASNRYPTHTYQGSGPYTLCFSMSTSTCTKTFCDSIGFDGSGHIKRAFKPFTIKVLAAEDYKPTDLLLERTPTINVYPNPFSSVLNISSNKAIRSVKLIGMDGRTILEKPITALSVELNTTELQTGLYILEITLEDGSKVFKQVLR